MDKKNFTIGAVLLIAAFAVIFLSPKPAPTTTPQNQQPATTAADGTAPAPAGTAPATAPERPLAPVNLPPPEAVVTVLGNEFIEARLTNIGGAIQEVALKKYPVVQGQPEPYRFNHSHRDPILAFTETDYKGLDRNQAYQVVSSSPTEVVYRTVLESNIEVTRRYRLMGTEEAGADPYRIHHETTFRNLGEAAQALPRVGLSVGTATLVNEHDIGQFLNVAWHDGEDSHYTDPGELEAGWFSGAAKASLPMEGVVSWGAVKNQFFTSIYTTAKDQAGNGIVVRRVELPAFPNSTRPNVGMAASVQFALPAALAPNATAQLSGIAYVGPLEYSRIAKFDRKEDRAFPFFRGFNKFFLSGFVSPLLNTLMTWMHRVVNDWGVAIIMMTLLLKIVTIPFTLAASRSAKRMAKLQPLMQEIREKYKDNPQKQQMATMELFKTHKVNPVGGCIPILITMPLFIGFFAMLQAPAELRFQSFLWARDLAAPDTVGHLFGIDFLPINIMPLLMGATMYIQMRLTPTPSVDNMQVKMMRFMPVIFTFFCYTFSCALSLYSTINGLFTIGQQIVINRMKDDDAGPAGPGSAAATTASAWKKGTKNVTPKKK